MSGLDAPARGLATRAVAAADRRVAQDYAGTLPAALGWDTTHWPIRFGMRVPVHGRRVGWCSISFDGLFPGWRARTTVYCDVTAGVDTNSGLTAASPVKTLSKAITVANGLADAAVAVRVVAGAYLRPYGFQFGGAGQVTKDIVFYASGGRVILTATDSPSFTVDGTSAVTWTTALTNCTRVMDMATRDALGRYTDLQQVASAALCYLIPGSWALVSGTLYVHRADGAQPSATNTRVFRPQDLFAAQSDTQYNLGFTGDTDADGFDFEGGNTAAVAITWSSTAVPASPRVFAMKGCSLRYAGGQTGATGLLRINNHHGLIFLENCAFGLGVTDSINIHNLSSPAGVQTHLLTLNCVAYDSGSNLYTSCNAWTMHETAIGIDICGDYQRAKGCTFHIIGQSRALAFGTAIGGSQGDKQAGGTNPAAELKTDDTAEIWADAVVLTPNGAPGYELSANARIHLRNMPAPRFPRIIGPAGVLDSW